jgi:4-methyl-5(b-hydroxyethyl)-thiazole monophosphate biosynthesis
MLYMFFADGFEETEAIASLDVIRRAGIDVRSVGVNSKQITGSHGVKIICDMDTDEATFTGLDGVILPGGMPGTLNLFESRTVRDSIEFCASQGRLVCAICAAPLILGRMGLLEGAEATCFPGFEHELKGAVLSEKYTVTSGNIITSKGMGSAVKFGLEIVRYFKGDAVSDELAASLQIS